MFLIYIYMEKKEISFWACCVCKGGGCLLKCMGLQNARQTDQSLPASSFQAPVMESWPFRDSGREPYGGRDGETRVARDILRCLAYLSWCVQAAGSKAFLKHPGTKGPALLWNLFPLQAWSVKILFSFFCSPRKKEVIAYVTLFNQVARLQLVTFCLWGHFCIFSLCISSPHNSLPQ